MKWPWRKTKDTTGEACRQLEQLRARDPEVERLAAELREAQLRNHFSAMVQGAIARRHRRGSTT